MVVSGCFGIFKGVSGSAVNDHARNSNRAGAPAGLGFGQMMFSAMARSAAVATPSHGQRSHFDAPVGVFTMENH